ncbi:hypothetical protein [Kitasatospora sp. NPDC059599]|uniref:hypothetical protein n=1 Tax=Kitasatospora sp. NPDC059599 TaxID=3346880 RepID=UPI00369A6A91
MRLNEEELGRWEAARDATERKELGAWTRAVVEEALQGHPGVPGDVPRVPEVNEAAYAQLVQAAAQLNELVRLLRGSGQAGADIEQAIAGIGEAAMAVRGMAPVERKPRQGSI